MGAEQKILDLKYTHITHGLERLAKFGIDAWFWNRLRFDDAFVKGVADFLKEHCKVDPGKKLSFKLNKNYTRFELNAILALKGVECLGDKDIARLEPNSPRMWQSDLIGHTVEYEWYIVDPGYRMDIDCARTEIDRRGLVPANTEDALAFMLSEHSEDAELKTLTVLDAWAQKSKDDISEVYLEIGRTVGGRKFVRLYAEDQLSFVYLAKKKKPEPQVDDSEVS